MTSLYQLITGDEPRGRQEIIEAELRGRFDLNEVLTRSRIWYERAQLLREKTKCSIISRLAPSLHEKAVTLVKKYGLTIPEAATILVEDPSPNPYLAAKALIRLLEEEERPNGDHVSCRVEDVHQAARAGDLHSLKRAPTHWLTDVDYYGQNIAHIALFHCRWNVLDFIINHPMTSDPQTVVPPLILDAIGVTRKYKNGTPKFTSLPGW